MSSNCMFSMRLAWKFDIHDGGDDGDDDVDEIKKYSNVNTK